MSDSAGPEEKTPRAPRPGTKVTAVTAALLLVGGGTAVAIGLLDQDADPASPAVEEASPSSSTTPGALPAPETRTPEPSETTTTAEPRLRPVELRIPAIDVQSEVTVVGLNQDGTLEVPQPGPDYDKAAWYEGSPTPGQTGPSVIEGHVDSAANGPSVFYDLGKLQAGDRVEITREDGSVVAFVVDDVRAFPKDDFPTSEVYGNTEGPELRLITCGGQFDSSRGHYANNTVVFAHQV